MSPLADPTVRLLRVDPLHPDPEALRAAAEVVRGGGLVAFPTETVYGLGANALDEAAVRRIFAAKGRPAYNPLIAHLPDLDAARRLASRWPEMAERAARAFWPGPLTLVVPRRPDVPDVVTAGLPTVALRVPAHPVAHALLAAAGIPLAAPSANRYTEVSPTTAEHVAKGLGDRVDLILDAGPTEVGIESTVLDVSGERPVLLRPGTLPLRSLEAVVGSVAAAEAVEGEAPRPAPGMVRRHYSPRGELRIFSPAEREAMRALAADAARRGIPTGALLLEELDEPVALRLRMPREPDAYARRLYAALHEMDDAGCKLILADAVPAAPEWAGIRDRLRRAAER